MKVKMRALIFRKRFSPPIKEDKNWWIVLGHIDEMECSCLKDMSLEDIKKYNDELYKNDRDGAYHHVVYLISDSDDSIEKDSAVWADSTKYLAITRIHFPRATDHQNQFENLVNHFEYLATYDGFQDIVWNTYYTTELSDMVLVSRSDSFQKLSIWALFSTQSNLVGDAYTYFCVPPSYVMGNDVPVNTDSDVLDFVSIRFSVKDNRSILKIPQIRNCLGGENVETHYRIAGNEDVILCGYHVPTKKLIDFYKLCYDKEHNIVCGFRDIITRIGANCDSISQEYLTTDIEFPANLLEQYSHEISKIVYDKILNHPQLQNREWLRPLVELTNALVHMSGSATLDEPVFLILPAINAFLANIINEIAKCDNSTDRVILYDDPMYWCFSELCIHTLEYLIRAEEQLSHQPEVRPLAYDIPVFVLEYVTSFLFHFNNLINYQDHFLPTSFLLVPSTEEMVSTDELFEATTDTPGLLQITVPFSLLYAPDRLLPTLCHELAHYVGEKFRMRELRYEYFLKAVSIELQRYFFFVEETKSNSFLEFLTEEFLRKSLYEINKNEQTEVNVIFAELPIIYIVDKIRTHIDTLYDYKMYAGLIKEYLLHTQYSGTKVYPLDKHVVQKSFSDFDLRLNDLQTLFRETYADICMLHFLRISPEKYFEVYLRGWEQTNYDAFLIQAYISLFVSGYLLTEIKDAIRSWGRTNGVKNKYIDSVCQKINDIANHINEESYTSEKLLLEYIQACKNRLEETFPFSQQPCENTIEKMYSQIVGNDSNYKSILKTIDESRGCILDLLKQNK